MTSAQGCCGRAAAAECRCYTDAAAIVDAIRAFIRRRVRHPQDAEDITQDALLRLYRGAHDLHDELALDAWMYRIARTAIIDHHRRAAVRPQPVDIEHGGTGGRGARGTTSRGVARDVPVRSARPCPPSTTGARWS